MRKELSYLPCFPLSRGLKKVQLHRSQPALGPQAKCFYLSDISKELLFIRVLRKDLLQW